jgi:hypothetical protein
LSCSVFPGRSATARRTRCTDITGARNCGYGYLLYTEFDYYLDERTVLADE